MSGQGSTVYLRQGVHEFLETMQIVRSVAIRAQEGVKADDCKIVIKEVRFIHVCVRVGGGGGRGARRDI